MLLEFQFLIRTKCIIQLQAVPFVFVLPEYVCNDTNLSSTFGVKNVSLDLSSCVPALQLADYLMPVGLLGLSPLKQTVDEDNEHC